MRILHLPVVAGRQAWGLSRAERALGHQSDFIAFENTFGKMPCDRQLFEVTDGVLTRELKRWRLFLGSIFIYDVFHFHFGLKFFVLNPRAFKSGDSFAQAVLRLAYWMYSLVVGRLDLWVLRLLGKTMFMTYHGDDIRQGDVSRRIFPIHFAPEMQADYYDDYTDERKRRNAAIFAHYCRALFVVSPDLIPMAPPGTRIIRHTGVNPSEWPLGERPVFKGKIPLIVHAPSDPLVKGTKFVRAAIENLRAKGRTFEFVVIEKMANDEARRWYEKADLVIDQLFLGWYGVLALECMALGKPVISYIRSDDTKHVRPDLVAEIPVISASPENIEAVLEECLLNPDLMRDVGGKSRAFVEKWYQPVDVAREVMALVEGEQPKGGIS